MPGEGPNDLFLTAQTSDLSPEKQSFHQNSQEQGCGQGRETGKLDVLGS